jgi:hypothetical protein
VNRLSFSASAFSDPQGAGTFAAMQWRLAEINDPLAPAYDPAAPPAYEIEPLWDSGPLPVYQSAITFPPVAKVGHAYRARCRWQDATGRWSHWSTPVTFITQPSDAAADLVAFLRVTELLYNPLGSGLGDYEFVELKNLSPTLTLDLGGVKFTDGIDFLFPPGTLLAPGAYLVVTRSEPAAFRAHFGLAESVAVLGPFSGRLRDEGELLTLKTSAAGTIIANFTYSPASPWPDRAVAPAHSIVPRSEVVLSATPGYDAGANWRFSAEPNGTPGRGEGVSYAAWAAEQMLTASDPLLDPEGDGLPHLLEYFLGTHPQQNSSSALPRGELLTLDLGAGPQGYLTLTFSRPLAHDNAAYDVQASESLTEPWQPAVWVRTTVANGRETLLYRHPQPQAGSPRQFLRLKVTP